MQILRRGDIFYGWFVVIGAGLVAMGMTGTQFSFGVFLTPMTEEFEWSRATLSLAFGTTFMLSGLLRPVAGFLADRYSPKVVALSGVVLMGAMLFLLPLISNLAHLYAIFAVMSVGLTLGTGSSLTKIVSAWFHTNRGLTLGLITGGGSIGAIILVPAASTFLVLFDWREAYVFLGALLLAVILPVGLLLIKNRPADVGLWPRRAEVSSDPESANATVEALPDSTFGEAIRTGFFWRLTFGYFV